MGEFEFVIITIAFVLIITFIVNRIISKKISQKKELPPEEEFVGGLNNLDKIVEGVSKKDKKKENTEPVVEEKKSDIREEIPVSKVKSNRKQKKYSSKKIDLKDTIVSKEIFDKKF